MYKSNLTRASTIFLLAFFCNLILVGLSQDSLAQANNDSAEGMPKRTLGGGTRVITSPQNR